MVNNRDWYPNKDRSHEEDIESKTLSYLLIIAVVIIILYTLTMMLIGDAVNILSIID